MRSYDASVLCPTRCCWPTLPSLYATIANYYIRAAGPKSINNRLQGLQADKLIVPTVRGQFNPVVKDIHFNPPELLGRIDILSIDPNGTRVETAEAQFYGEGFATDAIFTSGVSNRAHFC